MIPFLDFIDRNISRGGPLEQGLRRVINDVPIGSLLIQSDAQTGEPLLLHLSLPQCVRDRKLAEETWVFLLDAQVCPSSRSSGSLSC